jgi:hypothetical protein
MTEVQKGLITSKELGMAVADKLRQAEKRQERGGETPPKHQTPMRRALQPPATSEQRADRQVAPELSQTKAQLLTLEEQPQHRQKDLSIAPAPVNPDNHSRTPEFREDTPDTKGLRPYSFLLTQDYSRQNTPGTREYFDLDRARVGFPPITDEQWKEREEMEKRRERIQAMSIAELLQKYGIPNTEGKFIPFVPDSKKAEQRTFWDVIGAMIAGLIEGAAQSRKDKPEDKK